MRFVLSILFFLSSAASADDVCSHPRSPVPAPLVTGNGFGYATVARDGTLQSFLAHPYTVVRENADGSRVQTANFLKSARWMNGTAALTGTTSFVDESQVIETRADGYRLHVYSPFSIARNLLVVTAAPAPGKNTRAKNARLEVRWNRAVASRVTRKFGEETATVYSFKGVDEKLVVLPLSAKTTAPADAVFCSKANPEGDLADKVFCLPEETGWLFLSVEDDKDLAPAVNEVLRWRGHEAASALAAREVRNMNEWKSRRSVCFQSASEKALYRQSETILRMGQIREANSASRAAHGLINASLPEGEFVIPFVRDMAYATVSLIHGPHASEAEKAVRAYFNVRKVGRYLSETNNLPYQISIVRYFGDGTEEADRSGYAQVNLEFDNWGLALWTLGEFYKKTHDVNFLKSTTPRGSVYETARDFIVRPLIGNLQTASRGLIVRKDTSVWEQNDEARRNYASSTILAIAGLRDFLPIARAMNDTKTVKLVSKKISLLELGFRATFFKNGKLVGAVPLSSQTTSDGDTVLERNEIDGALLEAINLGVIRDQKEARELIQRVEKDLAAPTGGYRRTNGVTGYERQEFVFIDINLARAYLRLNELAKAEAIMKRVGTLAARDNNAIPEMIQSECMPEEEGFQIAIGSPSGATPMVGYGAGAFNLYIAEREALRVGGTKVLAGGIGAPALEELPALPVARACK